MRESRYVRARLLNVLEKKVGFAGANNMIILRVSKFVTLQRVSYFHGNRIIPCFFENVSLLSIGMINIEPISETC